LKYPDERGLDFSRRRFAGVMLMLELLECGGVAPDRHTVVLRHHHLRRSSAHPRRRLHRRM
jgi:hypothetical protein